MFDINYVQLFKDIPAELATLIIATIPIAELRLSIPIALGVYKLSVFSAVFWSLIGNIIPAILIIIFLDPISKWLSARSKFFEKLFSWHFERTKKRFKDKYVKWGSLALILFVGIPLPFTGTWTGAVAAFLFGIPSRLAIFLIFIGSILASIIVTLLSLGAFNTLKIL